MLKNILNLKGAQQLSKKEQNTIYGGAAGDWAITCNSGVQITNAPDCDSGTTSFACANQGGFSGTCICAGQCQ